MMFRDRAEAGLLLAEKLKNYSHHKNAVIVAIPRGGLPIGYVIAKQLQLPLEVVLSKKIGHPLHKEFAIGAVTLSNRVLSEAANDVSNAYLDDETTRIRSLLKQRHDLYYGTNTPLSLKNKIVILVDDGVATGHTLISSIQIIEEQKPAQIIVALPVGPPSVIKRLQNMPYVNQTICLLTPLNFQAVGQFYEEFNQVSDDEVISLLKAAKQIN